MDTFFYSFEPEWVAAADMIHRYPQPNGSLLSLTSHFINYYNCDFYSFPTSTFLRYLQSERTDLGEAFSQHNLNASLFIAAGVAV